MHPGVSARAGRCLVDADSAPCVEAFCEYLRFEAELVNFDQSASPLSLNTEKRRIHRWTQYQSRTSRDQLSVSNVLAIACSRLESDPFVAVSHQALGDNVATKHTTTQSLSGSCRPAASG